MDGMATGEKQSGGELQMVVSSTTDIVAIGDDFIRSRIYTVRGVQVMLDSDLARISKMDAMFIPSVLQRI